MMPSYSQNKWYAIYFVSYLCTTLYVMMNLMLAVVNETFTSRERNKFKKLFLHKRKACQHAFRLLVSKQNPDKMRFRQFEGLMRYFAPNKCTYNQIINIILLNSLIIIQRSTLRNDSRHAIVFNQNNFISTIQ